MNKKNILQVPLDDCTAKEAMKAVTGYMSGEFLSTIEFVTMDMLMQASEDAVLREDMAHLDLALPGDPAVLEVADITDKKKIQEVEGQVLLRMLMHYFHKNHSRMFILADTEQEKERVEAIMASGYGGVRVIDAAVLPETEQQDDGIANRINGAPEGIDCVLASLESPRQEAFLRKNREVLNARLWVSAGRLLKDGDRRGLWDRMKEFLGKKILKREAEKKKREEDQAGV